MKRLLLLIFTLCGLLSSIYGQHLDPFGSLIGEWKGSGQWSNGSKFNQTVEIEWGLNGKLVKVKTYGNIDPSSDKSGLRNEGIRAWNSTQKVIQFWEFDVFGGITSGTCNIDGKNIYYVYSYDFGQGPIELTDGWIYKENGLYELKIGVYKDNRWTEIFAEIQMIRSKQKN